MFNYNDFGRTLSKGSHLIIYINITSISYSKVKFTAILTSTIAMLFYFKM